jgi:ABC-type uncharacterized transport system ATPase component
MGNALRQDTLRFGIGDARAPPRPSRRVGGSQRDSFHKTDVSGIFISHNMHQFFDTSERIVVMARREIVRDCPAAETDIDEIQYYI